MSHGAAAGKDSAGTTDVPLAQLRGSISMESSAYILVPL